MTVDEVFSGVPHDGSMSDLFEKLVLEATREELQNMVIRVLPFILELAMIGAKPEILERIIAVLPDTRLAEIDFKFPVDQHTRENARAAVAGALLTVSTKH